MVRAIAANDLKPVIDRGFPLEDIAAAFTTNPKSISARSASDARHHRPVGEDYKTTPALEFLPDPAQVYRLIQGTKTKMQR
jgi:hypothetical protein